MGHVLLRLPQAILYYKLCLSLSRDALIPGTPILSSLGPKGPVDPEAAVYHANRVPRLDCYSEKTARLVWFDSSGKNCLRLKKAAACGVRKFIETLNPQPLKIDSISSPQACEVCLGPRRTCY